MLQDSKRIIISLDFSHDPSGTDASYINVKDPRKHKIEEMQAHKSITLNALDKSVDLSDLPCDVVLDFDKNDKLIGIEIIGNVIPDELKD